MPSEDECVWLVDEVVGGGGVEITAMTEEILDGTTFNWQKKYWPGFF